MINYNPKEWFTFIFRLTKEDTFRRLLPLMIAVSIYSGLIAYIELNYLQLSATSELKNFGLMHSVLGFVISLLLVFRTNTAYDRWWEGRKKFGILTNSSRNLAIKLDAFLADKDDKAYFAEVIALYASSLKYHLRDEGPLPKNQIISTTSDIGHWPNHIASLLYSKINALVRDERLSGAQLQVLDVELKIFTDVCGACERIKNTPIPFTYSVFIKKFIFFYVMTLPFGWAFSLGYYTIPVVALVLYAFASLELIAEEIENPFGTDANDLPIDQICANIRKHVGEILIPNA